MPSNDANIPHLHLFVILLILLLPLTLPAVLLQVTTTANYTSSSSSSSSSSPNGHPLPAILHNSNTTNNRNTTTLTRNRPSEPPDIGPVTPTFSTSEMARIHPSAPSALSHSPAVSKNLNRDTLLSVLVTPLPLLHNPPEKSTGKVNSAVAPKNQSSVSNLLGDEKEFLNEIVKNFNKSLTLVQRENVISDTRHSSAQTSSSSSSSTMPNVVPPPPTKATSIKSIILSGHNRNTSSKLHYHKSDSAMLNYIFDTHVKHRHSDLRFGPHFVEVNEMDVSNVSVLSGATGLLNCKISQLQDRTVSWVRRIVDTGEMTLLTVGTDAYSSDSRFAVDFQYPDNWRLKIENVNKGDEGTYNCQISGFSSPQAMQINVFVSSPEVLIVDEQGLPLYEKFYNLDSLLELVCIVRHITMTTSVVYWLHGDLSLNYDTTRGGTSVRTDLTEEGANSTLSMARLKQSDSGNYTCSIGPNLFFTTSVHVLNESLAELYHGHGVSVHSATIQPITLLLLFLGILFQSVIVTSLPQSHIRRTHSRI